METVETGNRNRNDFHCMQMNLMMRMHFIFGDDWDNAQCLSGFSAMEKCFLHARNHTLSLSTKQGMFHAYMT